MPNYFQLVLETPNAGLVAEACAGCSALIPPRREWNAIGNASVLASDTADCGARGGRAPAEKTGRPGIRRWECSLRLNHRRKVTGHAFSGRYKALLVDGGALVGRLKTVCDCVHLNPLRARMLQAGDRLSAYPGSSMGWYLATREHRPPWMCAGRLLGAHGIPQDTAAGRAEFESRMEERRRAETEDEWDTVRRGWCLGSEVFRQELLEKMESTLGDHHAGELKLESAAAKAERIIAAELQRLGWTQADLRLRLKGDPAKMALANRLKQETIMSMPWIADRLSMGTPKSARARLRKQNKRDLCVNTLV